jgi:hypothetical protein
MDRAEQAGLGLSLAGHVALVAALSIGLFAVTRPAVPPPPPIEVEIIDQVRMTSATPDPAPVPNPAPAPMPAPMPVPRVSPPRAATPPVETSVPAPRPAPAPPVKSVKPVTAKPVRVRPAPVKSAPVKSVPVKTARPTAAPPKQRAVKAAPAAAAPTARQPPRRTGLDRSLIAGLRDAPAVPVAKPGPAPTAAVRAPVGPAQQAALGRVIREQLKPRWKAPAGADAELLRTSVRVTLARDGAVTAVQVIETTGITDSNRAQVRLHQEAAVKAVRLASPFTGLPAEYYELWSTLESVGFDRRLSQ